MGLHTDEMRLDAHRQQHGPDPIRACKAQLEVLLLCANRVCVSDHRNVCDRVDLDQIDNPRHEATGLSGEPVRLELEVESEVNRRRRKGGEHPAKTLLKFGAVQPVNRHRRAIGHHTNRSPSVL